MRTIVADVETTGVAATSKICEVAWKEIDEDLNVLKEGYSLINPGEPIPYAAAAVNGITDAMVQFSPTIEEYMIEAGHPLFGEDVVLIAHNCLTGDHEVRTQTGWTRLDQLDDGVDVLQWCPHTSDLSFVRPLVVRNPYDGKILEWDTQYHKGAYTPDHRIYFKGRQGAEQMWRVTSAQRLATMGQNSNVIPVSGVLSVQADMQLDITPDEARVIEMVRADACVQQKALSCSHTVRFKFKKARKVERCKALLDSLGISYGLSYGGGCTNISIHAGPRIEKIARLLGASYSKGYGSWVMRLSVEARKALLDETQYWDGSKSHGKNYTDTRQTVVYSSKAKDVEWLCDMAVMTGMSALTTHDIPNTRGFSTPCGVIHKVAIRPRKQTKLIRRPTETDLKGSVYCVTVPSGAFMVRRKGATWVTGNCQFDHRYLSPFMHDAAQTLCTLKCARIIYPDADNHKQATLAYMLGIEVARDKAHSADGDLDVLLGLVRCLMRDASCSLDELLHIQNIPRKITKMPFGKHKGAALKDLPTNYTKWLFKLDNLDPDLRAALLAL